MAAPRFFVPLALTPSAVGQVVTLPAPVAHHAVRVVRLAAGDALTLFTGEGGEFAATLVRGDRDAAVRIDAYAPLERESPLAVTLAQAIAANDAMDYAIRKAVELGAAAIQPVVTERSAPLPAGERGDKRIAHWRGIAVAACEQCGRNRVPEVAAPRAWSDWLASWRGRGLLLVPDGTPPATRPPVASPLAVAVGPEGGFAEREIAAAQAAGFERVSLGPRVLRTETAAVAALAAVQALWGDLR